MRAIQKFLLLLAIALAPATTHAQSTPAKADTAKIDVTGKWAFTLETPFPGTPTVTFTQKGDSISGTYTSQVHQGVRRHGEGRHRSLFVQRRVGRPEFRDVVRRQARWA
jgi:hypothetical protein